MFRRLSSGVAGNTVTSRRKSVLARAFFARDVDTVARELLGGLLLVGGVGGKIVETESYDHEDPASHAYLGRRTARNAAMFGPPGHAYVYRSYGIHWCLNFVCLPGSAVLIRALEPTHRLDVMQKRRATDRVANLCSGPGKLCEALGITGELNGGSLFRPPFTLHARSETVPVCTGPRIGITKAIAVARRFGHAGSPFLSRPFR
jgi:DNA-3-methyladenine glycosylase